MNTRRFKDDLSSDSNSDALTYIDSVRSKLINCGVKVETIIERCRRADRNQDNIIHADDLVDVLYDLVPRNTFSKRELHYLIAALTHEKR